MSVLYLCQALEKQDAWLRLRVTIIHPDAPVLYASKSFAIQLLYEYSDPARIDEIHAAPMFRAIPPYAIDADARFVALRDVILARVVIEEDRFYPVDDSFEIWDYTEQLATLPQRVLRLEATDPSWLEHVRVGDSWEAAANDWERYL